MNSQLNHYALKGVLNENPWLGEYSCGSCPSVEAEEFTAALDWFATEGPPMNLKRSTYSLKRDAEEETGQHIGERAFVAAAIVAGYRARQTARAIYLE